MNQAELISAIEPKKLDAFKLFCSSLRKPVFTENNHIIAGVNVVCYENHDTLRQHWGEVLLITHGYGFGNIRISEGEQDLFNEGIYNLLESPNSHYSLGRMGATLVIEAPWHDKIGIHRIDLVEDLKRT